jgi:hypothetical protein
MRRGLKTFAAGLAIFSLAAVPSPPVTDFFGEVSDPVGDAFAWGWVPASRPAPDLEYASVQAAEGQMVLTVRFAPGTFADDVRISCSLDTDTDPSTGWPGTTSGRVTDAAVLGVDYSIDTEGSVFGGKAKLFQYTRTSFTVIATDIDVTFNEDGLEVAVPLSLLGDDDGRLYFKVTTQVQINESGATFFISDWITDPNTQPGSTVPADEEVADLGEVIEDLESAGTLDNGPARALSNHLDNALRALEAGHANAARAQLEAFIAHVEELLADGTLTEDEAEPLLSTAERLLAGL